MSSIIVFGAAGRAGRAITAEARLRGHRVTAVVRDPAAHPSAAADGALTAGDVTDPAVVARLAAGHDAAVVAAYAPVPDFFATASAALIEGLTLAGVPRLLSVGLASVLPTASGVLLMDAPGYPQEYREFYLAHATGTEVLRTAPDPLDWLVLSPSGDFDHQGGRTGGYVFAPAAAGDRISYPDLAVAVLDEIDRPAHHRTHLGVRSAGLAGG
ncbi:NAD(P)-dependent oxidoreductase [Kitasatospora sp. NPDC101801]|uniref:NAD(P)-dependent oxidoreductase n=1 Tax=Kitasatospora sp. NPDC101801 TaxID=3364103 RepID=UPI00382EA639